MRIGLLGGLSVEHDGRPIVVSGAMQLGVFFRLAVDAGRVVSVREIVEDVWGLDAPENERAALQSVISRLRSQLPPGSIESTPVGYRLTVSRQDVDALAFQDLVAAGDPGAIGLWAGDPWIPSPNFDWFERDLLRDRANLTPQPARSSIPAPLTSLVGRATELAMIADQLPANRLVTIVGTGGAGKTRLAVEAARSLGSALLAELAPVGKDEVLPAILSASGRDLRTAEAPELTSTRERILDALHGRDVLLVLDNCEHVIDEVARVAADLLGSLPGLRILATSREPLAIPGEAFVAVGSLPADAAVELFRQRAVSASSAEPDLVRAAAICTRLDGLPLAIELAAAKLRTMTIDEVADGLEHRFTLLTGGYRTALPRHQTLRAMIDWSWSLLTADERVTLTQLAVFPAGIDAADTAALAAALGVRDSFDSLVDRSLLQRVRGRYRTLETIREYGLERLADSGQTGAARTLQSHHQAERTARFDRLLRGPRINEAIAWFDAEEDNISSALRFAVGAPLPDVAVQLAISCAWYWVIRDRSEDATTWFPLVIPISGQVDGVEAEILRLALPLLAVMSDGIADLGPAEIVDLLAPMADIHPSSGTHDLIQVVPRVITAFLDSGDPAEWMVTGRVPNGEELGLDPWPCALLHVMGAVMAQNRGDIPELEVQAGIAVAQFEEIGDLWGLAISQQMRSEWLMLTGRLEEALVVADASSENMRSITASWDLAQQQGAGIQILLRMGRTDEARERSAQLLRDAEAAGNSRTILQATITAAMIDVSMADLDSARTHAARMRELIGDTEPPAPQTRAFVFSIEAGVAMLEGDTDAAVPLLRESVAAAISSNDHPVIGMVALAVGSVALARGDIATALTAVDLSTAVVGIYDATNPQIAAIERAARDAGIGRPDTDVPSRPNALQALRELTA